MSRNRGQSSSVPALPGRISQLCNGCGVAIGACACGGGAGSFVADMGGGARPSELAGWNAVRPNPGCYPRGIVAPDGSLSGFTESLRNMRGRPVPYQDPMADFLGMDTLVSAITTIGPGATVNVDVQPDAGTFTAFYYKIVVVDETTQATVNDWRYQTPGVVECPVPCAVRGDILSQFGQHVPESCCGHPIIAFLDKRSENVPLRTPITNNQAAGNVLAQVMVRGYCCSTRIC